jgi:hypothetical protein
MFASLVSDVVGSLATKGLAMNGRYKEKDAYDIYSELRYCGGGPEKMAEEVRGFVEEPFVAETLEVLKAKFRSARSEDSVLPFL